jgi:hypothetical protein
MIRAGLIRANKEEFDTKRIILIRTNSSQKGSICQAYKPVAIAPNDNNLFIKVRRFIMLIFKLYRFIMLI